MEEEKKKRKAETGHKFSCTFEKKIGNQVSKMLNNARRTWVLFKSWIAIPKTICSCNPLFCLFIFYGEKGGPGRGWATKAAWGPCQKTPESVTTNVYMAGLFWDTGWTWCQTHQPTFCSFSSRADDSRKSTNIRRVSWHPSIHFLWYWKWYIAIIINNGHNCLLSRQPQFT